jgi:hypothetical protein
MRGRRARGGTSGWAKGGQDRRPARARRVKWPGEGEAGQEATLVDLAPTPHAGEQIYLNQSTQSRVRGATPRVERGQRGGIRARVVGPVAVKQARRFRQKVDAPTLAPVPRRCLRFPRGETVGGQPPGLPRPAPVLSVFLGSMPSRRHQDYLQDDVDARVYVQPCMPHFLLLLP